MNKKHFSKRSDAISVIVVGAHLIVVVSPIYVAAALGPGWYVVLCWLLFGLSMNGVLNLMHECAHFHVFRARRWSHALGTRLVAPLVFANFETYRRRHWDHHKFIGVDGETKETYLIGINKWRILGLLARCLLMSEAANKFLKQTKSNKGSEPNDRRWISNILLLQSIFASSLLAAAWSFDPSRDWRAVFYSAGLAYGAVYLYGVMSLTVFLASLRAIAEHQQYDDTSAREGYAALRNFACNPLSRFIMGAYGFGEHYTHHRVPGIPYYNLKAATTDMAQRDVSLRPEKTYFDVLADIVTR